MIFLQHWFWQRDLDILEIVHNLNGCFYVDSDSKINDAVPVSSTSEMHKIIKSMCSCLDAHLNGKMNKIVEDFEQFVDNIVLKKMLITAKKFI